MKTLSCDLLVIGTGIAGLTTALSSKAESIIIIGSSHSARDASSNYAQGGIAAAMEPPDSPASHSKDTIKAASGCQVDEQVNLLTSSARDAITFLRQQGINFDGGEHPELAREAAHSHPRILHIKGDQTGHYMLAGLFKKLDSMRHIQLIEECTAFSLLHSENGIEGALVASKKDRNAFRVQAANTVLATGGYSHLYKYTSAPSGSDGWGIAIAMAAGADLSGLEFTQFHPTTLDSSDDPQPLISEAVRGEGAILLNSDNKRFMIDLHPDAELAPRDIVSRGIWQQQINDKKVWLDCRHFKAGFFEKRFPAIHGMLAANNIHPEQDLIPVTPSAHYSMGGITSNQRAESSLPGLLAAGECTCTGVHGANRLASNSLLEAVVFGQIAAKNATRQSSLPGRAFQNNVPEDLFTPVDPKLRDIVWAHAGISRNESGLKAGLEKLKELKPIGARHILLVTLAEKMIASALERTESVGAHFRSDQATQSQFGAENT